MVEEVLGLVAVAAFGRLIMQAVSLLRNHLGSTEREYLLSSSSSPEKSISVLVRSRSELDSAVQDVLDTAGKDLNTGVSRDALVKYAAELEDRRAYEPLSRSVYITLGRLYKRTGQLQRAIDVLTEFIENKERIGQSDEGLGIALYNRACYLALKTAEVCSEEATALTDQALGDLRKAVELAPRLATVAPSDADFQLIRDRIGEQFSEALRI